jgi:DNA-binding transcriptional LysR family regulator
VLDRIESMKVFLKAGELGSLSGAARYFQISPSMVTKHIAAQEQRLGIQLLRRTTRRVTFTDAGKYYRDVVARIVADVEEVEAWAAAEHLTVRGILRITAPVSFGTKEISPLLLDFHRRHPELVVDLGLNDRVVDLAEEGWDVAIRIGQLAPSGLIARKLAPCRMILCAAPSYLRARGTPVRVADLRQHECLGYTLSRTVGVETWTFGINGEITIPVVSHFRANNGEVLLAAALAGQGLTYQPTFILGDAIRSGALVQIPLDHSPLQLGGVYAVYPPGSKLPAKTRVFIDFLAARFVGVPSWDRDLGDEARR